MSFQELVVVFILTGSVSSFLLTNSSSNVRESDYHDVISLLVDEKNARHMLENRLDKLEQFNIAVTKELQKDRNNRQQLIDENNQLSKNLENAVKNLTVLKQEYDLLKGKDENQSNVLENVLSKINVTAAELSKLNESIEQYCAVTGQTTTNIVERYHFDEAMNGLNNSLLEVNKTIRSLTSQTSLNYQTILKKDVQLGFSLKEVDKASYHNRLKFKIARLNKENMFNMSTGEFVCTRAGLYFFTTTIVREPGIRESYCSICILPPGSYSRCLQTTVGQASSTSGYASGTTSLVYHLDVGDKVFVSECDGVDHMHWSSSFSGFLIIAD